MKQHRDTLFVEDAEVLSHQACAGNQYILRLRAPEIAARATPGSFVHLTCDPLLPMRRPLSLMRADAKAGWVEVLYKITGLGTRLLAQRKAGERLSVMGPIGVPFTAHENRPRALLLGGGVGIPPMIFLAEALRAQPIGFRTTRNESAWATKGESSRLSPLGTPSPRPPQQAVEDGIKKYQPFVIMGSEIPFPFTARPSKIIVPGMPEGVIAAMPLMEDWGIASRLASLQGYPGCFEGYVTGLARHWLGALSAQQRDEVEIFACGPQPMLKACAQLAREYGLPCQVSLEEFMACAVGGCAGCVVEVTTAQGPAMKRVCVDGPVFDAAVIAEFA